MEPSKTRRRAAAAARSNRERTETTRRALLEAARALFVEKGYGATSTPEVAAAAGITRGALYHHFADKRDLFRQVLDAEAAAVREDILAADRPGLSAQAALIGGAQAYLQAMTVPGRTRLLLIEGPAALGAQEALAIDDANAGRTLREGLAEALGENAVDCDALARLMSAAFDRAALEIDAGGDAARIRQTMLWTINKLLA
ncbi:TetR/AcrR family transcriptional regulator [Lysobacter sp. K5869]|uniref:TetR/AcrR family transcriptional regulator n=1 Tax=Lysobacter sp. K5869 TaxID=2820808 RepID=UPI001C05FA99|nr:TetR/AcrR family transcriptional regulator [Lysobacter sp. K5869]QWP75733.1 TetR/AcrR family transcriptional regulator [Lysobacter sp. K5869]